MVCVSCLLMLAMALALAAGFQPVQHVSVLSSPFSFPTHAVHSEASSALALWIERWTVALVHLVQTPQLFYSMAPLFHNRLVVLTCHVKWTLPVISMLLDHPTWHPVSHQHQLLHICTRLRFFLLLGYTVYVIAQLLARACSDLQPSIQWIIAAGAVAIWSVTHVTTSSRRRVILLLSCFDHHTLQQLQRK